jgi:hypothetical protein
MTRTNIQSRRDFLQLGLGLTTTAILGTNVSVCNAETDNGLPSVIWIWLGGGISMAETINPLPEATAEIRSVRGHIQSEAGFLLSGDFPYLASKGGLISPVLSFKHSDANHQSATGYVMTSQFTVPNQPSPFPSYGSLLSHQAGVFSGPGIPTYVRTTPIEHDGPAWLGNSFIGMQADENGVKTLTPTVERERFNRRMEMQDKLSSLFSSRTKSEIAQDWQTMKGQAADIIRGKAGEAFDLSRETPAMHERYQTGRSRFGKDALLAKRLLQSGVRFVTLSNNGWDNHVNIAEAFERKGAELDAVLYNLLEDLDLERTLVVITTEFGRTYKVNSQSGRDHQVTGIPLIFAGGGYSHGRTIGGIKDNVEITDSPFDPEDLSWTIFNYLGFEKTLTISDNLGRPHHMFGQNAKNILES